jgi:hypothetical protein
MVYSVADFRGDVARLAKALTEPLRDSVRAHPQSCRPLRFSVAWRRSAHPRDEKDAWARLEEAFGCCVKFPFSLLVTWLFPALCGPLSGCADIASVALDGLYRIFVYVAVMAPLWVLMLTGWWLIFPVLALVVDTLCMAAAAVVVTAAALAWAAGAAIWLLLCCGYWLAHALRNKQQGAAPPSTDSDDVALLAPEQAPQESCKVAPACAIPAASAATAALCEDVAATEQGSPPRDPAPAATQDAAERGIA